MPQLNTHLIHHELPPVHEPATSVAANGRRLTSHEELRAAAKRVCDAVGEDGVSAAGTMPTPDTVSTMIFERNAENPTRATIHFRNADTGEYTGSCTLSARRAIQIDKIELAARAYTSLAHAASPLNTLALETTAQIVRETMSAAVHDANKTHFAQHRVPLIKADAARIAARQAAVLKRVCARLNSATTFATVTMEEVSMEEFSRSLRKLAGCDEAVFEKGVSGIIKRTNFFALNTSDLSAMSPENQEIFFAALDKHVKPHSLRKVVIYHPERRLSRSGRAAPYHEELTQRSISVTAAWNKINPELPVEMIMHWDNAPQPFVNAFDRGSGSFCNVKKFQFACLNPAAMAALAANFPHGTVTNAEICYSDPGCLQIFTDALIKGDHAIDSVTWSMNGRPFRSNHEVASGHCAGQAFSRVITSDKNTLVHLGLNHRRFSPDGVNMLAEALSHENCILETLDLHGTPLGREEMLAIIRAANNAKTLKVLELTSLASNLISLDKEISESINAAKEKNPKLEVKVGIYHVDEFIDPPAESSAASSEGATDEWQ